MTEETLKTDSRKLWYIVHTYSGHEQKVVNGLKQRIEALNLQDKFGDILIPTKDKVVISEGKKRTVEERLFPGYVLISMALGEDTWPVVRNTAGVTGFVGVEGKPTPVPDKQVQSIIQFSELEAPRYEMKFAVGDIVKIIDGPFTDFSGKIDYIDEERGKLRIIVNFFGRETPVEVEFTQIGSI